MIKIILSNVAGVEEAEVQHQCFVVCILLFDFHDFTWEKQHFMVSWLPRWVFDAIAHRSEILDISSFQRVLMVKFNFLLTEVLKLFCLYHDLDLSPSGTIELTNTTDDFCPRRPERGCF